VNDFNANCPELPVGHRAGNFEVGLSYTRAAAAKNLK
jgi:hypothetical protein